MDNDHQDLSGLSGRSDLEKRRLWREAESELMDSFMSFVAHVSSWEFAARLVLSVHDPDSHPALAALAPEPEDFAALDSGAYDEWIPSDEHVQALRAIDPEWAERFLAYRRFIFATSLKFARLWQSWRAKQEGPARTN